MARGLDINAAAYDDQEEDGGGGGGGRDMRVSDWEDGLPSADDLTPLSQPLIPPELASAFSITPEPSRTLLDVHRATQTTISTLRRQPNPFAAPAAAASRRHIPSFTVPVAAEEHRMASTEEDEEGEGDGDGYGDGGGTSGSSSSAAAEAEAEDGASGAMLPEMSDLHQHQQQHQMSLDHQGSAGQGGVGVAKRSRLVWTPQLHRRFVEVVAHLGVANAVPKTIMQLMNVEGLTRENVASHLQKYRLYLKRTHGHEDAGAGAGPSASGSFVSSAYTSAAATTPSDFCGGIGIRSPGPRAGTHANCNLVCDPCATAGAPRSRGARPGATQGLATQRLLQSCRPWIPSSRPNNGS